METPTDTDLPPEAQSEHKVEHFQEQLTDLQNNVEIYIKENPFKAIGFSLLTGVVIAQLIRMAKKDEKGNNGK